MNEKYLFKVTGFTKNSIDDHYGCDLMITPDCQTKKFDPVEMQRYIERKLNNVVYRQLKIAKVIFNDPATIVLWSDGTKTVVKAQGNEPFDPEKGLAMAISKKAFGNKGSFNNEFKKWLRPDESEIDVDVDIPTLKEAASNFVDVFTNVIKPLK